MINTTDSGTADCMSEQLQSPEFIIERTYRATVNELWELWTTKQGFESWWGPEGFRVEVHTFEAYMGGAIHYDMIADSPEMIEIMKQMGRPTSHPAHVRFSEFTPHSRLAITTLIDFLPEVTPYESTVVVEFHPSGDTVRMVLTLEPMHSDEFTKMATLGFTGQLSKLDRRYSAG